MYSFEDLLRIMEQLREGCPWDREQTYESLKRYVLEEAHEVIDAVEEDPTDALPDELGDLLLQVVFYAQIGKERQDFTIDDVLEKVCTKMIHRHPHVFGEEKLTTSDQVLTRWASMKKKEKGQNTHTDAMKGISTALPALLRAYKVQESAAKVGFDWEDVEPALQKVREETAELETEIRGGNQERITDELGDLLFAAVNVARFAGVQPELALGQAIDKFIRRFSQVEEQAVKAGKTLEEMTLAQMDELWEQAKKKEF